MKSKAPASSNVGKVRTWILAAVALMAFALIAAACSSDSSDNEPTPTPDDGAQIESPTAADGAPAGVEGEGGDEVRFVYTGADVLGGAEVMLADVVKLSNPGNMNFCGVRVRACQA